MLEHAIAVRGGANHPDAVFYDMLFLDFVEDQFAVVEKIYERFGLPMSGMAADRMRAFIADNPKGKHGIHRYAPEEFGVKPDAIRQAFRPYMERFGALIEKKARLGIDSWGSTDQEVPEVVEPVHELIAREFPDWSPYPWSPRATTDDLVRHILFARRTPFAKANSRPVHPHSYHLQVGEVY